MCQQKQNICLLKKTKWWKKSISANGRGLYQSNQHHPRNMLTKYFCDRTYHLWVISQNAKHLITDHKVALLILDFNMLSIFRWDTFHHSNMNSLTLLVFEILAFKHSSHRLSIINFYIFKKYIKSLDYARKKKGHSINALKELNILIFGWFLWLKVGRSR